MVLLITGCSTKQGHSVSEETNARSILKKTASGVCLDIKTNAMWQVDKSSRVFSQQDAATYVENLVLEGYDDWRLPSNEELLRLHRIFYWKNNGDCVLDLHGDFWAKDEAGEPSFGHWETDYLFCGPEFKYIKSRRSYGYVRAIRP